MTSSCYVKLPRHHVYVVYSLKLTWQGIDRVPTLLPTASATTLLVPFTALVVVTSVNTWSGSHPLRAHTFRVNNIYSTHVTGGWINFTTTPGLVATNLPQSCDKLVKKSMLSGGKLHRDIPRRPRNICWSKFNIPSQYLTIVKFYY